MEISWKNAREFSSVTKDGVTYQYRYNKDGMRNRKYLSDGTVYYQIEGDLIVGEQKIKTGETEPEYEMEFIYDSSGNVIALLYNGTEFYYEKNLQGDIVAIRNVFGELSVTYEYDSWGNVISIGGLPSDRTLGELNPFRYRGYYYDSETGFYYVSSRYYDPEVGRFISPDNVLAGIGQSVQGYNLYSYCFNNPVNMDDPDGNWPKWVQKIGNAVKKTFSNVVNKVKSVVTEVKKKLTKKHYEERANKNGVHPTYNQVVSSSSWTKVSKDQTKYHDNGVGKAELKFTNSDGREAVFNGDTLQPMTDPRYIATYNFCPIQQLPESPVLKDYVTYGVTMVGHTWQDVIPYYIWGNSPDDTTTFMDRILMSF